MGAIINSCCWGVGQEMEFIPSYLPSSQGFYKTSPSQPDETSSFSFSPTTISNQQFYFDLLNGDTTISVLLQDGSQLPCKLSFDAIAYSFSIVSNNKKRVIHYDDIKSVLHGSNQLKKVETKAELANDPNCVAFHLKKSGNCIPIHFESIEQKNDFLSLMSQLKDFIA